MCVLYVQFHVLAVQQLLLLEKAASFQVGTPQLLIGFQVYHYFTFADFSSPSLVSMSGSESAESELSQ